MRTKLLYPAVGGGKHLSFGQPSPCGRGGRRGGFTLIELLVVISIIALLISILLPALAKVREAAKMTQCMAQQRSIGQAVFMYAGDFEDQTPQFSVASSIVRWTGGTYVVNQGPALLLHKVGAEPGPSYLPNRLHLFCPSQKTYEVTPLTNVGVWAIPTLGTALGGRYMGYVYWISRPDGGGSDIGNPYYYNHRVTEPGNSSLITDFGWRVWADLPALRWIPSHPDGINNLYLGGHVKTVSYDKVDNLTQAIRVFRELCKQ